MNDMSHQYPVYININISLVIFLKYGFKVRLDQYNFMVHFTSYKYLQFLHCTNNQYTHLQLSRLDSDVCLHNLKIYVTVHEQYTFIMHTPNVYTFRVVLIPVYKYTCNVQASFMRFFALFLLHFLQLLLQAVTAHTGIVFISHILYYTLQDLRIPGSLLVIEGRVIAWVEVAMATEGLPPEAICVSGKGDVAMVVAHGN